MLNFVLIKFLFELGINTTNKLLEFVALQECKRDSLVYICLLVENSLYEIEVHYAWWYFFYISESMIHRLLSTQIHCILKLVHCVGVKVPYNHAIFYR